MAATIKTPAGSAPVIPVLMIGAGFYLAWFAIHYWGSDTKWPADPVKAVLTGKPLPAPSGNETAAQVQQNIEGDLASGTFGAAATGPGVAAGGAAPSHAGTYDIPALEALWTSQGGSGQTAFEAANVAMAESGGNPLGPPSANPDGGTNVGLWQLDTKGVGAGYTIAQLQDPATNCRITIMHTANGTDWHEWADAVVVGGVYVGPKV